MKDKKKQEYLLTELSDHHAQIAEIEKTIIELSKFPIATELLLNEIYTSYKEIWSYLQELKPYGIERIDDAIYTLAEIKEKEKLKNG
jgi:hypothetical protein